MPDDLTTLTHRIESLNSPDLPNEYVVDGHQIRGSWKKDDPQWENRLRHDRAPLQFVYLITLRPSDHSYRWAEQDAGYRNGRLIAYKGYSRGFSINLFTMIVWAVRRLRDRRREGDEPRTPRHRDDIKAPVDRILAEAGWRNRGIGW